VRRTLASTLAAMLVFVAGQSAAQEAAESPAGIAARAMALQKEGRLAEAADAYQKFLAQAPSSWEGHSNLGVVYVQLGRYEEAVREYREALRLNPGQDAVRYNLALALLKASRVADAARELETILKAEPNHQQATLLLADCRLRLGEWKAVIALLDPLLEQDAANPAILYMIGTALMRDKQHARGQRVLDRILSRGDSAEAHLLLALACREADDDLAAQKELEKALALNPQLPTANAMLGGVLMRMGEHAAAAEAFERELKIDANDFESHLLLGTIRRQEFDQARARVHLERAIALRPADPAVRYQLALVEIAAGELEAAVARLEPLVAEYPSFSEAHVSLGTLYYRLNRKEDGEREQAIVRELARQKQERQRAEQEERPSPP